MYGCTGAMAGSPSAPEGAQTALGGHPPLGGQHRMPCVRQPLAHAVQAGLPATKRRSDEQAAAWLMAAKTL